MACIAKTYDAFDEIPPKTGYLPTFNRFRSVNKNIQRGIVYPNERRGAVMNICIDCSGKGGG